MLSYKRSKTIGGSIGEIKVGVTTGLYYIARAEELATSLKKVGYTLTRGVDAVEIAADSPHEINYTIGKEIRHLTEKQGVDLTFHGSLTIPMAIPERSDWRDAQDHIEKSIRSAVLSGCKYVLFHACLHFWVELITYTSAKLDIVMCDHLGRFISEVLYENKQLREWFVKSLWDFDRPYHNMILDDEALTKIAHEAEEQGKLEINKKISKLTEDLNKGRITKKQYNQKLIELATEQGVIISRKKKRLIEEAVRKKLSAPSEKERRWNVMTYGRFTDAYLILANHMFLTKDPIWIEMTKVYGDLMKEYNLDYTNNRWVDYALKRAEETNDRRFKEFYYGVVAAKFIEGHMKKALKFINGRLMKELEKYPDAEELKNIAKNLKITLEIPDARDPKYAGLYLIWHPKQLYVAVKTIRKTLKTDRIFLTMDYEHLAGHGVDPLIEVKHLEKIAPDFGKYVLSVHANTPNPLHAHYPIEYGDVELYELLYFLRKTGMGKQDFTVYLFFERGGGEDPFRQAVDALKLMKKFLEKDIPPDELPEEFFGIHLTGMDVKRQEQIIMEHRFEPLKDLLEIPEEEWGFLSSVAVKKGKTKEFRKEEMR